MKTRSAAILATIITSLVAFASASDALAQQIKPDETKRIELNQAYGKLPLSFEGNQGQTDPQVKYCRAGLAEVLAGQHKDLEAEGGSRDNQTQRQITGTRKIRLFARCPRRYP